MPSFAIRTLALATTLMTVPVFAQESVAPGPTGATVPAAGPASPGVTAGRLQKTEGGWRSSRIVGATVYNDSGQSIGSVDDLLVGDDGKVTSAVISVGGFLGIGSKLVKISYDRLRFEEQKASDTAANAQTSAARAPAGTALTPPTGGTGTPTTPPGAAATTPPVSTAPPLSAAAPANIPTTRIVLPGASKDSLTAMPTFDYGK